MPISSSTRSWVLVLFLLLPFLTVHSQDCDNWDADITIQYCGPDDVAVTVDITGTDTEDDIWWLWFSHDNTELLWYVGGYPGVNIYHLSGFASNINAFPVLNLSIATAPSPNEGWCVEYYDYSISGLENFPDYANAVEVSTINNASCEGVSDGSVHFAFDEEVFATAEVELVPEVEGFEYSNWGVPKIENLPPGEYTAIFHWNGTAGCFASAQFEIGSNEQIDFGLSIANITQPFCSTFDDDTGWGYPMNVGQFLFDNDGPYSINAFTFEVFDQQTDEPLEIFGDPALHISGGILLNAVHPGEGYVVASVDGIECSQVIYYEGVPMETEHQVVFDVVEPFEYYGDLAVVDFDLIEGSSGFSSMLWELDQFFDGQSYAPFPELVYQFQVPHGHEMQVYLNSEFCPVTVDTAFYYESFAAIELVPKTCPDDLGEGWLIPDVSPEIYESLTWSVSPYNPNLLIEATDTGIHLNNLDDQVYCFQFSSSLDPDFSEEVCLLHNLWESGWAVQSVSSQSEYQPICPESSDGTIRVQFAGWSDVGTWMDIDLFDVILTDLESQESWTPLISDDIDLGYFWLDIHDVPVGEFLVDIVYNECTYSYEVVVASQSDVGPEPVFTTNTIAADESATTLEFDFEADNIESVTIDGNSSSEAPFIFTLSVSEEVDFEVCYTEGECCYIGTYLSPNAPLGCTDSVACNYDPIAVIDDGSCVAGPDCGDFNGDGVSDTADLLIFIGAFGNTGNAEICDLNGDNIVNSQDLVVFLGLFSAY